MKNQNWKQWSNALTQIFIGVSILVAFIGLMAAVFGWQSDVSQSESGFALTLGILLLVFGLVGAWLQLRHRNMRISMGCLLVQVLTFSVLLAYGP